METTKLQVNDAAELLQEQDMLDAKAAENFEDIYDGKLIHFKLSS